MIIKTVVSGVLSVNSYFVINEKTNEAILIDGGQDYNLIKAKEKEYSVKIVAELLTHAHFDHSGNAHKLQQDGVVIYCSNKDALKLKNNQTLSQDFGRVFDCFTCDKTVDDNDEISIAGFTVKVIATAGHTDGSVCYLIDDVLFSGDTLFYESFGRYDFPSGNINELINSVKRLLHLEKNYRVLTGHGEETTIEHEKAYNPIGKIL